MNNFIEITQPFDLIVKIPYFIEGFRHSNEFTYTYKLNPCDVLELELGDSGIDNNDFYEAKIHTKDGGIGYFRRVPKSVCKLTEKTQFTIVENIIEKIPGNVFYNCQHCKQPTPSVRGSIYYHGTSGGEIAKKYLCTICGNENLGLVRFSKSRIKRILFLHKHGLFLPWRKYGLIYHNDEQMLRKYLNK